LPLLPQAVRVVARKPVAKRVSAARRILAFSHETLQKPGETLETPCPFSGASLPLG
jgi:hypothetical protein